MHRLVLTAITVTGCLIVLTGCSVTTPSGTASVIEGGDLTEIGLAAYPGARPRNDAAGDNKTASLAVSTPLFGLKIASAKFQTEDSADKVLAFYRKEMSKYGDVVDDHKEELKVGPDDDLHIVAVKPTGKGTEFTLVYAWVAERDPQ